ncbi:hypothetical protein CK510_28420 [Brunnivagina elsteri CCALA 953]|uniref:Uncharacterized protein n=2 Tax=Brunnivagina TaxID=3344733 RepID=A0A2A2TAM8_9CYAN|nr:hypothetical protein CK510_28420 [Calothrix elsteri CCALA 953]
MRRAERKSSDDDNAINNPRSRKPEPIPPRDLQLLLGTIRAQRDQWQQKAKDNEEAVTQAQQEIEAYQNENNELKERAAKSYQTRTYALTEKSK